MKLNPHRMEIAKEKLREVLSYEKIKSKEKYKNMREGEYEEFIEKLETLSLLIVQSYFRQNPDELP